MRKFIDWCTKLSFAAAVVTFFCITVILLYKDHSDSAAISASLLVVLAIIWKLPLIEFVEAAGFKLKLRQELKEAKDILSQIKLSAFSLSKSMAAQIAVDSRIGGLSWDTKKELILDISHMMRSISASEREIDEMIKPFLRSINVDLFAEYYHVCRFIANDKRKILESERNQYVRENSSISNQDEKLLTIQNRLQKLKVEYPKSNDFTRDSRFDDLKSMCEALIKDLDLESHEEEILKGISDKIYKLSKECEKNKIITDETVVFLSEYSGNGQDARYKALFNTTS